MSTPASRTRAPHRRRWEFLLFLLPLLGVLCLGGLLLTQGITNVPGPKFVPVNLHSILQADYGANPNFMPIQSVGLDIIWDAILDREPDAANLKERQEALLNSLQTPIPFVTPVTCQGVHIFYAGQDTWIDSASPTGRHGSDLDLRLGRDGDHSTRLLLHFTPTDPIQPGIFIKSARLELNPSAPATSTAPRIRLFSGITPFEESAADWSNQPEPLLQYRADALPLTSSQAWDITDLVRDWLLGRQPNNGLIIELLPPANALYLYHSKEAGSQASTQAGKLPQSPGPRLVIDCGDTPSQPETLAATTPTPLPTGLPQPAPAASTTPGPPPPFPLSTPTPLPAAPTAIVPPATPTSLAPAVTPTPVVPPPTPASVTPPATSTGAAPSTTPEPTRTPIAPTSTNPPPTSQPPATSAPPSTSTATPVPTSTPTATSTPTSTSTFTPTPTPTLTPTATATPVPPSLSINDVTVAEGNAGTVNAVFTVSLSAASTQTVTVTYATANNLATAPADYTAAIGGPLNFAPGLTSQTITIAVQGDTLDEMDETFFVNLSGATNATIGDGQGVGTITDDDGLPSLSINDVTVTEGNAGTVNAVFTVSLSAASAQAITVNYATANNTATAPADYTTAGGPLNFAPGLTSQTITVTVQGDLIDEPDETFLVNLSGATNAIISDGQGIGTIIDDDITVGGCSSPVITLTATADTYFRENQPTDNFGADADLRTKPPSSSRNALIQFDLSAIPANSVVMCAAFLLTQTSAADTGQNIEVHRVMAGWVENQATWNNRTSANAWTTPGGDFNATVEAAFVPSTANHVVNITSLAQFWVNNSASNFGLLLEAQNVGSNGEIQFGSRETANPPRLVVQYLPGLSISDVTVLEGDSGVINAIFTVTMSAASGQTVTVDYTTVDNTATTADSDYLAASGTLTFPPGSTTQLIMVTVNGDTNGEGDESFLVNLSNPVNAAIADGQGIGMIQQDLTDFALPPGKPPTIYLPLILK